MAKLLLIEDDPAVAEAIMFLLERHRHAITHVASLSRAKKFTAAENFDAAIVDVWLDGDDGLTFLADYDLNIKKLPVIVISGGGPGRSLETVTARADSLGAIAVLYKPFSDEDLLKAVDKALTP